MQTHSSHDRHSCSQVTTLNGTKLAARQVLLAGVPPPALLGITMEPPLPRDAAQLMQRLPLGTSLKYMVTYPSRWWKRRGFLGKITTTAPPPLNSSAGAGVSPFVSECLDNSPNSSARGVIMCFIEGRQNRAFFRALPTPEMRRAHVAAFLNFSFEGTTNEVSERDLTETVQAEEPLSIIEHNWADKPYTRGESPPPWLALARFVDFAPPQPVRRFTPHAWLTVRVCRPASSLRCVWPLLPSWDTHRFLGRLGVH